MTRTAAIVAIILLAGCHKSVERTGDGGADATIADGGTSDGSSDSTLTSSSALGAIARAEANGTLDHDTADLDRLLALFSPRELPAELQGTIDVTDLDATVLLAAIKDRWDSISPTLQAAFAPYFARPTSPDSKWSQIIANSGLGFRSGLGLSPSDWSSVDLPAEVAGGAPVPVRIHYLTTRQPDADLARGIAQSFADAQAWTHLTTTASRTPCSDVTDTPDNGGDNRVDVYLVPSVFALTPIRRGASLSEPDDAKNDGIAIPGEQVGACGRFGFALVSSDDLRPFTNVQTTCWDSMPCTVTIAPGGYAVAVVGHELFHVFQFAEPRWRREPEWNSWVEASATYAEHLTLPDLDSEQERLVNGRGGWSHTKEIGPLGLYGESLAQYASYIFPYYLAGTYIGVVRNIWDCAAGVNCVGNIGFFQAVQSAIPHWAWASDYLRFAVHLLNLPSMGPHDRILESHNRPLQLLRPYLGDDLDGPDHTAQLDLAPTAIRYFTISSSPKTVIVHVRENAGSGHLALSTVRIFDSQPSTIDDWPYPAPPMRRLCFAGTPTPSSAALVVVNADTTLRAQASISLEFSDLPCCDPIPNGEYCVERIDDGGTAAAPKLIAQSGGITDKRELLYGYTVRSGTVSRLLNDVLPRRIGGDGFVVGGSLAINGHLKPWLLRVADIQLTPLPYVILAGPSGCGATSSDYEGDAYNIGPDSIVTGLAIRNDNPTCTQQAMNWIPTGASVTLGDGVAYAINGADQNLLVTPLPPLNGYGRGQFMFHGIVLPSAIDSWAQRGVAVNNAGTAVGDYVLANVRHGIVWRANGDMVDLWANMALTTEDMWLTGLNERGDVVGYVDLGGGQSRGFMWDGAFFHMLSASVPPGDMVERVAGINNNGDILAEVLRSDGSIDIAILSLP
jgi:hypothetical protein